ncbi:hypothetical protein SELMODRAFT_168608 [Selaginella moellendorffii]|uniref:Methyltransferase n=1 Tax=Selaginella moellendorffii TaxID=88036 RepID=D8R703_SELML|nr:probable methyltransferase PMT13 [Selaginella moellendorffii]EFJ31436.1 hypothetical protein SELMODRAFT_168608 [Selaginella moellendorffii]|eukprot:XP_002966837.1 probable methyltransferase PMT13 [Selaginella moellendorffii]
MSIPSPPKQRSAGGRQWKLLDMVMVFLFAGVFIFFLLLFTPLGDSMAASGLKSLDSPLAMEIRPSGRQRLVKLIEKGQRVELCAPGLADYMPCQDPKRSSQISRERNRYRERHCPPENERLLCRIPSPRGYKVPVPWPDSLNKVWYSNMPYGKIAERKGHQGWMKKEGEYFIFPGGGTMFPEGAWQYIEKLEQYIPLSDGQIRTALDAGCGVASFGAYMLRKDVLTMSFAPRDSHKAQIQFALERGIPAFVAMLGTQKLPFPAFSYDLVHCSRCLIHFSAYNGSYMIEMDRLLRPGGFFVLSGPPVGWKKQEAEWQELQELIERMCYTQVAVENNIAIWQKALNHTCYVDREDEEPALCDTDHDPNAAWYSPLDKCLSRLPDSRPSDSRAGGKLPEWPKRLQETPRRFHRFGEASVFERDSRRWSQRVKHYKEVVLLKLGSPRYRNILDMNAGYGGFAAALYHDPVWVMNVVPVTAPNTLPVIFDRGLIGVLHDWCEAFSTYPRTYDFIHVSNMQSFTTQASTSCSLVDVMLEMDRILRPQGTILVRDTTKMVEKISKIAYALQWTTEVLTTEGGVLGKERLFVATKPFHT